MLIDRKRPILVALIVILACGQCIAASCRDSEVYHTLDGDTLWRDLTALADDDMEGRKANTLGSVKAQQYITRRFAEIGVRPVREGHGYRYPFNWPLDSDDAGGVNLLGMVEGSQPQHGFIVISAHYDHLGKRGARVFNGADDNASGVAVLLAIAQVLTQIPPVHNVLLLVSDAEERGLLGTKAFIHKPVVPIQTLRVNLNLDMMANGGRKKRLYVFGHRYYPPFHTIIDKLQNDVGVCLKPHRNAVLGARGQRGDDWRKASDHGPFASAGIPFLFLSAGDHPQYHTTNDTVEYIDPHFFQASAETALSVFRYIDALPYQ